MWATYTLSANRAARARAGEREPATTTYGRGIAAKRPVGVWQCATGGGCGRAPSEHALCADSVAQAHEAPDGPRIQRQSARRFTSRRGGSNLGKVNSCHRPSGSSSTTLTGAVDLANDAPITAGQNVEAMHAKEVDAGHQRLAQQFRARLPRYGAQTRRGMETRPTPTSLARKQVIRQNMFWHLSGTTPKCDASARCVTPHVRVWRFRLIRTIGWHGANIAWDTSAECSAGSSCAHLRQDGDTPLPKGPLHPRPCAAILCADRGPTRPMPTKVTTNAMVGAPCFWSGGHVFQNVFRRLRRTSHTHTTQTTTHHHTAWHTEKSQGANHGNNARNKKTPCKENQD